MARVTASYERMINTRATVEARRTSFNRKEQEVQELTAKLARAKNELRELKADVGVAQLKYEQAQEEHRRAEKNRAYRQAKSLMERYQIEVESEWMDGGYYTYWVNCPEWIEGDDPIVDGHFGHDWFEVLDIVDTYAKHHPKHPQHHEREYQVVPAHV